MPEKTYRPEGYDRFLASVESDARLTELADRIAAGEYDDVLHQMGREAATNLPAGYRFGWEKGEVACTDPALAGQPGLPPALPIRGKRYSGGRTDVNVKGRRR